MTAATTTQDPKPATKTPKAAAPADEPLPKFEIAPGKFNLYEQVVNRWVAVVPGGIDAKTLARALDLQASPFALIADMLHEGDDVRCVAADKRTMIDLVCVRRAGQVALCAVTRVIHIPAFSESEEDLVPAGYEVVRAGPDDDQAGWLCKRKSDGWLMNKGSLPIFDKIEAVNWLRNHAAVRGDTPQGLHRPTMF